MNVETDSSIELGIDTIRSRERTEVLSGTRGFTPSIPTSMSDPPVRTLLLQRTRSCYRVENWNPVDREPSRQTAAVKEALWRGRRWSGWKWLETATEWRTGTPLIGNRLDKLQQWRERDEVVRMVE